MLIFYSNILPEHFGMVFSRSPGPPGPRQIHWLLVLFGWPLILPRVFMPCQAHLPFQISEAVWIGPWMDESLAVCHLYNGCAMPWSASIGNFHFQHSKLGRVLGCGSNCHSVLFWDDNAMEISDSNGFAGFAPRSRGLCCQSCILAPSCFGSASWWPVQKWLARSRKCRCQMNVWRPLKVFLLVSFTQPNFEDLQTVPMLSQICHLTGTPWRWGPSASLQGSVCTPIWNRSFLGRKGDKILQTWTRIIQVLNLWANLRICTW